MTDVPRGTSASSAAVAAVVAGTAAVAALASALLWGELVHARASRRERRLPSPRPDARLVVVILGFANRGPRIKTVNRWRARIGVRTAARYRALGCHVTILCSGGPVHGEIAEADLLRRHVLGTLRWDGEVISEPFSGSTWENVRNALPVLDDASAIAFASNGLHAEKARVYLARQRPDLAPRLVPAETYRVGEMTFLKPVFAAIGLWKLRALFHVKHP